MLTDAELTAVQAAWIRVDADPAPNSHGIIRDINEYGARMFGYDRGEIIGKPLSVLIPMRDQAKQAAGFDKASNSASYLGASFIVSAVKKDGAEMVIWHKVGRCTDTNGKIYFVAMAFRVAPDLRF